MEEADKDWMMIRMLGGGVFLLVPAHPGSPGQRAVRRSLLLLLIPVSAYPGCTGKEAVKRVSLHCAVSSSEFFLDICMTSRVLTKSTFTDGNHLVTGLSQCK